MQFINYFLASLITFAGLIVGIILIKIAPEEQKPLERYFSIARIFLLITIFAFLILFYFKNYLILTISLLLFSFFIEYKMKNKHNLQFIILGIVFFISSQNQKLLAIESALIFLYGVLISSLLYKKETSFKILLRNSMFLIVANLLYHFSFLIFR